MTDKTILDTAAQIVEGTRADDYGSPVESWENVAAVWSVILGRTVTAKEAVLCMMALKIVREASNHKLDNLIDSCGYARIAEMIEDAKGPNS